MPCPYCKRQISEEAQWCPHCENYVSREDAPPSGSSKSGAWVVLMILALLAAAFWALGG